jgi:hypothetical protein
MGNARGNMFTSILLQQKQQWNRGRSQIQIDVPDIKRKVMNYQAFQQQSVAREMLSDADVWDIALYTTITSFIAMPPANTCALAGFHRAL